MLLFYMPKEFSEKAVHISNSYNTNTFLSLTLINVENLPISEVHEPVVSGFIYRIFIVYLLIHVTTFSTARDK